MIKMASREWRCLGARVHFGLSRPSLGAFVVRARRRRRGPLEVLENDFVSVAGSDDSACETAEDEVDEVIMARQNVGLVMCLWWMSR
jgi:hypothetical protein